MTTTAPVAGSPVAQNLFARFVGIITAPKDTFAGVVSVPRVLGMLLLTAVLMSLFAALPMTTPGGRQAAIDKAEESMKAVQKLGITVDMDKVHEQMERTAGQLPYRNGIGVAIAVPIVSLVLAGILFAIFNAGMGGEASYKQALAVVVHAGVISTLSVIFAGLLNFFRQTVDAGTNLGMLFPFLPEQSFVVSLFSAIDVFRIWWIVVLAMGLAVLYRRRTAPIAYALLAVYAVFAVGIALFKSFSGGA